MKSFYGLLRFFEYFESLRSLSILEILFLSE